MVRETQDKQWVHDTFIKIHLNFHILILPPTIVFDVSKIPIRHQLSQCLSQEAPPTEQLRKVRLETLGMAARVDERCMVFSLS